MTYNIICIDADAWEITNSDGRANMSGFVNKLLPQMYASRILRREKLAQEIGKILGNIDEKVKSDLLDAVNTVADHTYFSDYVTENLEKDLYIRPNKNSIATFIDICENEVKISKTSPTEYIRDLLNEYVKKPMYARKEMFYRVELDMIYDCMRTRTMTAIYSGKSLHFTPLQYIYGYGTDQELYILLYDVNCNILRSIPLHQLKNFAVGRKFKLDNRILEAVEKYIDTRDFVEHDTFEI